MKLRTKDHLTPCYGSNFNMSALNEVLVNFDEGDADSMFVSDLQVQIGDNWKNLISAFKDRDLITDNHNTCFFQPRNEEEKKRGYSLA